MNSYLERLWRRISLWWQRSYELKLKSDTPEEIDPYVVYLVGNENKQWAAVFKCPCGCGDAVWLNLLTAPDRPTWHITKHLIGHFSIYPSVRREVGCRSHFFIRRGRVLWS